MKEATLYSFDEPTEMHRGQWVDKHESIQCFFSIVDLLSVSLWTNNFLTLIKFFMLCLQTMMVSLWMGFDKFWRGMEATKILCFIAYWHPVEKEVTLNTIVLFTVLLILSCATVGLGVFHWFFYRKNRRLAKGTIHATVFMIDTLAIILIIPTGNLIGVLTRFIADSDHFALTICILVFSLVAYAFQVITLFLAKLFLAQSMFASSIAHYTRDATYVIIWIVGNSVFQVFGYLFSSYPVWTYYVMVCLHMAYVGYCLSVVVKRIYLSNVINAMLISLTVAGEVGDIMALVSFSIGAARFQAVYLGIVLGSFVVSFIVCHVVLVYDSRKIEASLAYDQRMSLCRLLKPERIMAEIPTDEERMERIVSLRLNEWKGLVYLYVGMSCGCDLFVDSTLSRHLMTKHPSIPVCYECLRIVSFFPSRSRSMHSILAWFRNRNNLSLPTRYLISQVERIRMARRSNMTVLSAKLKELRIETKELAQLMKHVWTETSVPLGNLHQLAKLRHLLGAKWEELIDEFPNNVPYQREYLDYLIECCCDFRGAVLTKGTITMIESNLCRRFDHAFAAFIALFPKYWTREVLTKHGVFWNDKNEYGDRLEYVNVVDVVDDGAFTENVIQSDDLFSHPRLRVALQTTLKSVAVRTRSRLVSFFAISIVSMLILLPVMAVLFWDFFTTVHIGTEHVLEMGRSRHAFVKGVLGLILNCANVTDKLTMIYDWNHTESDSDDVDNYELLGVDMLRQSQDMFESFSLSFTSLTTEHDDIVEVAAILSRDLMNVSMCTDIKVLGSAELSLVSALAYEDTLVSRVTDPATNWTSLYFVNSYWCSLLNNINDVSDKYAMANQAVFDQFMRKFNDYERILTISVGIVPFAALIMFFLPIPVLANMHAAEIVKLVNIALESADEEARRSAKDNVHILYDGAQEINTVPMAKKRCGSTITALIVILTLLFTGIALCFTEPIDCTRRTNEIMKSTQYWLYTCIYRRQRTYEVTGQACNAVLLAGMSSEMRTVEECTSYANQLLDEIDKSTMMMMTDSRGVEGVIGKDLLVDELILREKCDRVDNPGVTHDLYACAGVNDMLRFFRQFAQRIITHPYIYNGVLASSDTTNMIHLCMVHTESLLIQVEDRLSDILTSTLSHLRTELMIWTGVGIVLLIMYIIVFNFFVQAFDDCVKTAMIVLMRLAPMAIGNNSKIMDILYDRFQEGEQSMGITESIVCYSNSGIVCITLDGMIEYLSHTITQVFQYSRERLLGQNFSALFDEDSTKKIANQLSRIVDLRSKVIYEDELVCITDDEKSIPCDVKIFQMRQRSNNAHIVLVVTEITALIEGRKAAELAKQQSEDLLLEILPRQIVSRINSGEADVSFSVPIASIMFIDLVRFSMFSHDLSPQAILGTISNIFGAFDSRMREYPTISRIKVFGDVYMCASGLFSDEASNHRQECQELVASGIDALDALEDIGIKMNAVLAARIGINTGGPIIAGVIGNDRIAFDIIGDSINIASRLQTTAPPNCIQMSVSTYTLISHLGLPVRRQENVVLKGKGTASTYLLRSINCPVSP